MGARVILATGGMAALWARTTNPPGSQGTGLLLAHAAGAQLADLEMLQFHPTAVIGVSGREGFLITEAIRGEGATLHDAVSGERFVDELAPRDEVSRAIQARLRETGARSVGLDMRAIDPARSRTCSRRCARRGSIRVASSYRWRPQPTTRWEESLWICRAAPRWLDCMPWVRCRARGCTERTGSPPTR